MLEVPALLGWALGMGVVVDSHHYDAARRMTSIIVCDVHLLPSAWKAASSSSVRRPLGSFVMVVAFSP